MLLDKAFRPDEATMEEWASYAAEQEAIKKAKESSAQYNQVAETILRMSMMDTSLLENGKLLAKDMRVTYFW